MMMTMMSERLPDLLDPGPVAQMSPPSFDEFWAAYPRKQGKAPARKRWAKMSPAERLSAWLALPRWVAYYEAVGQPQFVPHGSTWLNQQRWEDDVPALPQTARREAPGMASLRARAARLNGGS